MRDYTGDSWEHTDAAPLAPSPRASRDLALLRWTLQTWALKPNLLPRASSPHFPWAQDAVAGGSAFLLLPTQETPLGSHLSPEPQLCTPLCPAHPSPTMYPTSHGNWRRSCLPCPITSCSPEGAEWQVKIWVVLTSHAQRLPCTILGGCKPAARPPATCPRRHSPAPLAPSPPARVQGDKTSPHPQRCLGASVYPRLVLWHMGTQAGKSSVEQWARVSSQHGAGVEGSLGPAER